MTAYLKPRRERESNLWGIQEELSIAEGKRL
jgi:hypothetical protein